MTPDMVFSILAGLGPYAALGAAVAVIMYLNRKRDVQWAASLEALTQRTEAAERRAQAAEVTLAQIRSQVADLEEQARLSSGAPAKSWSNINRRTQAVRMLRSGDKPSSVAAELSMSRAEVELIRRVQSLTSQDSSTFSMGN